MAERDEDETRCLYHVRVGASESLSLLNARNSSEAPSLSLLSNPLRRIQYRVSPNHAYGGNQS
jgi:hypothetical protein